MDSSYLVRKLLGSTRRFLLFILIIALFILTGVGAAYFVFGREGRGVSILPSNPNLPATGGDGQSEIGDVTQKLTVNAQLQVNGQFKLTPTSVPQSAAPGTIIFDQESSTLLYHNGTEFVSVESQQPLPPAGVTSLQGQTGAVNLTAGAGIAINGTTISATGGGLTAVNGTAGHVNVVTSGGVATLSLPQPIGVTETPTFAGLNLSGDMVLDSAAFLFGNNISQTAPGQDVAVSAGNDAIIFTAGGRTFEFPTSGPASQTICTTGISCAAGGGQAVLVAPGSAQTDNTADVSIFINDTGGGNLIQLQSGAADRFVVAANGNATISGSLTLGTALGLGSGGTGATTAQGAINAISGLTTNGDLLYHNGVNSTRLARGTNGQCLISTGATIQWDTCTGAGGVSSLNSFNGAITLQGTTNQITVNNNAGTITLSTPQDINTGASPTFAGMTLNGALSVTTGGISVTGNSTITGTLGSLTGLSSSGTIQFSSLTTNGFVKTTGGNGTLTVSASVDLSAEVTGTLAVGNGGTGATTAQGAINALSGLTTTGDILYYDGANTTRLPRGTNGQCLLSTGATVQWDTCTGAGGVSALNTFTGAVTLQGTANQVVVNNNAGTITLSTPQDINTNSSPTFSGLTLSSLAIGGDTINDFTGTGLQVVGNSLQTTLGTDIDLAAEVTGVLPIANGGTNANNATDARTNLGAAASGANSDITSTIALNTITPSGALTIGATGQSFTLQGSSASVLTAADSGNTTTIGFVTPTADVTINFPALSAGTYQICTTSGNCLGAGGGANTSLSNLSSVAINTSLLPGATNIDLGSGANPFRDLYLGGTATNNFRIMGSASAARTITLPDASGEVCLNTGNCVGSGGGSAPSGASYITLGLSGDLTAERVLTAGTNIQINDGGANDNLTVSTVDNPTFSTSVTTPQLTSSGALSITSSGALSVGSSSQTLTLQGSSSSSIVITDGANSTTLDFETPTASATIQFPALAAGTWEVCTSAGNCTSQAGVDSINTFTGDIVIQGTANQISVNNNAGTITLSTPQDINTSATPTFAGLTLNGGLSVTAGGLTSTGTTTLNLTDNTANVFSIQEGISNYLNITTANGSETVTFGNGITNPNYEFLGGGDFTLGGNGSNLTIGNLSGSATFVQSGGDITMHSFGGSVVYNQMNVDITTNNDENLTIDPNGTGIIELLANTTVDGTLSVDSLATFDGNLRISDGSSNYATITVASLAGDYSVAIPTITANDTFCLQSANNCPGNSKWTDGGTFTYLTSTTDDFVLGATNTSDAALFFDTSLAQLRLGNQTTSGQLTLSDSDNDVSGYIGFELGSGGFRFVDSSGTYINTLATFNDGGGDVLTVGGSGISAPASRFNYNLEVGGLTTFDGDLRISDGSSNYATLTVDSLANDYSVAIPTITANDTFCLETLGNCTGGDVSSALTDNIADALDIQEGSNNYININTTNSSEAISFGNTTTNPDYNFLGSGTLTVSGSTAINNTLTVSSTITNTGDVQLIGVTLGNDGNDDDVYGLRVSVTSANTGDGDSIGGIWIDDLPAGYGSVFEYGLGIGSGYDANLVFGDTSTVIVLADGGSIDMVDDSFNTLMTITDAGTEGFVNITGGLQTGGTTRLTSAGVLQNITGYTQSSGTFTATLTDNTTNALDIQEGTNNYINVNTTNSSEEIQFGNINTNPGYTFLGSGTLSVAGPASFLGQVTIGTSDTTGTLLVLDTKTSDTDPSGVDGAMYYNSFMGKFRCYEDDSWTDCITPAGAGSNRLITLRPEYEGVVFSGSGIGYLTASACGNQNDLSLNTGVCGSSEHHNYYEWTTVEGSAQSYSMYIRYQLPSDFDGFTDDNTIRLYGRRTNSTASVDYTLYEADGDRCGSVTTVTTSDDSWQEVSLTGNETSCTFAAGDIITFQIDMTAESGSIARVGELRFTYISVN